MRRIPKRKLYLAIPAVLAGLAFIFLVTTHISIAANFTAPEVLISRNNGLTVLDRNGVVLFEFDRQEGPRQITPLSEMSPHLINATVATEDAEFWDNPGVNVKGIARAVYENVSFWDGGGILKGGGGSSITQQLAKNLYIPAAERSERSLDRKIRETMLAFELNRRYSKEQILEWYLNSVFYGNGAYGAQAASYRYFSKPASDLTPAEAAMLAGIPRAPAYYDPLANIDAAKGRQAQVIDLLVRHDYITAEQAAGLKAEPLTIREGRIPGLEEAERGEAPHLAVYVRDLLPKLIGEGASQEGLRVTTSIDVALQRTANQVLQENLASLGPRVGANNGAIVAMDPKTGEVLVYVGSRDYFNDAISGQVDNVTALNQPGSTIKPITYLTAFIKGWNTSTIVNDEPIRLSTGTSSYTLGNADNRFRGSIPVRQALASSLNPPAVKALEYAGLQQVYDNARKLGLTTLQPVDNYGPAFTLGGADVSLLDLTYVFSVFANMGEQSGMDSVLEQSKGARPLDPIVVLKIEDSRGNTVWEAKREKDRIVPADHTYVLTHVLSDNNARSSMFGTSSPLRLAGREAAVKSGLTDNARDAWTIGFTPELVAGIWVGNANNQPMPGATSTYTAAPIWNAFMTAALRGKPATEFAVPQGVRFAQVCATTGQASTRGCATTVTEVFASGRAPSGASDTRVQAQTPTPRPAQPTATPRSNSGGSGNQPARATPTPEPGRLTPEEIQRLQEQQQQQRGSGGNNSGGNNRGGGNDDDD
jgi:membrane peptidoglycan carboxypeptidase